MSHEHDAAERGHNLQIDSNGVNQYWAGCEEYHWDGGIAQAEARLVDIYINWGKDKVLDIGCGRPRFIDEGTVHADIFPKYKNVIKADVRALQFGTHTFDKVFAIRLLSNLHPRDRLGACQQMERVAKPGGTIIVCDAFLSPYVALNKARREAGCEPLKSKNGEPLSMIDLPNERVFGWQEVAPNYYIWTRLAFPIQFGCFPEGPVRMVYPQYPPDVRRRFGVHNIVAWKKPLLD